MAVKFTQEVVLKQFIKKHGDKFDYSEIEYKGDNIPIQIRCIKHNNKFTIKPEFHKVRDSGGCKYCTTEIKKSKSKHTSYEDIIDRFNKIHNNYYNYELVKNTYENSFSNIEVICPIHGKYTTIVWTHLKSGCSKCGDKKRINKLSLTLEEFINKSNLTHNNYYDYSETIYVNYSSKLNIKCPKHGVFSQNAGSHIQGSGCPKCKISHGERQLELYFEENNIEYIPQYKFSNCKYKRLLPFDFYLPKLNICVEFHGNQHYRPIKKFGGEEYFQKIQIRDKIKINYCKENNIKLIIINEKNNKDLKQFFTQEEIESCKK